MRLLYKRRKNILLTLLSIIIVLYGVELAIKTHGVDSGITLGDIQDQTKTLKAENRALKNQLLETKSFRIIYAEAREMGFIELSSKRIHYLE